MLRCTVVKPNRGMMMFDAFCVSLMVRVIISISWEGLRRLLAAADVLGTLMIRPGSALHYNCSWDEMTNGVVRWRGRGRRRWL